MEKKGTGRGGVGPPLAAGCARVLKENTGIWKYLLRLYRYIDMLEMSIDDDNNEDNDVDDDNDNDDDITAYSLLVLLFVMKLIL